MPRRSSRAKPLTNWGVIIFLCAAIYAVFLLSLYIVPVVFTLVALGVGYAATKQPIGSRWTLGLAATISAMLAFFMFSQRASQLRVEASTKARLEAQKEAAADSERLKEYQLYERLNKKYEVKFISPQTNGELGIYVTAFKENGEEVSSKGQLAGTMYLLEGRYKVVMSADGYEPERAWITVPKQKNILVNFNTKTPLAQPLVSQESMESVYFGSCAAAKAAGAAPLYSGSAGYSRRLDRDGDGVACE